MAKATRTRKTGLRSPKIRIVDSTGYIGFDKASVYKGRRKERANWNVMNDVL